MKTTFRTSARQALDVLVTASLVMFAGCGGGGGGSGGTDQGGVSTTYAKYFRGGRFDPDFTTAAVARDGGALFIATRTQGTRQDLVTLRTDSAGDRVSASYFYELGRDKLLPASVRSIVASVEAADGSILVAVQTGDGPGLVKLDRTGQILWQRDYSGGGDVVTRYASDLVALPDGGAILGGEVVAKDRRAPVSSYERSLDLWLLRVDADGNRVAERTDLVAGADHGERLERMRRSGDGTIALAGCAYGTDSFKVYDDDRPQDGGYNRCRFWVAELSDDLQQLRFNVEREPLEHDNFAIDLQPFPAAAVNGSSAGYFAIGAQSEDDDGSKTPNSIGALAIDRNAADPVQASEATADASSGQQLFSVSADFDPQNFVAAGFRDVVDAQSGKTQSRGWLLSYTRVDRNTVRRTGERLLRAEDFGADPGLGVELRRIARTPEGDHLVAGRLVFMLNDRIRFGAHAAVVARLDGRTRQIAWAHVLPLDCREGCSLFDEGTGTTQSLEQTADGGVLMSDFGTLYKLDADGNLQFARSPDSASTEVGEGAIATDDGGFVLATGRLSPGVEGASVLKLAADGSMAWRTVTPEIARAAHVAPLADGDFAVADPAGRVARLSSRGAGLWQRRYATLREGAPQPLFAARLRATREGGLALLTRDNTLVRIDGNGGAIRADRFSGTSVTDVVALADGGLLLAGSRSLEAADRATLQAGESDGPYPFAARVDSRGNVLWSRLYRIASASALVDRERRVLALATADGGFALAASVAVSAEGAPGAGCTALNTAVSRVTVGGPSAQTVDAPACSDQLLLLLDAAGQPRRARTYGTAAAETVLDFASTADNGFMIAGSSNGFEYPLVGTFVVRTDADGGLGDDCAAGLAKAIDVRAIDAALSAEPVEIAVTSGSASFESASLLVPQSVDLVEQRACLGLGQAPVLDVTVIGNGRVTSLPAGIDCPGDCSQGFASGTSVTLTATPNPNETLQSWGGACAAFGAALSGTTTIDRALQCSADFSGEAAEQGFEMTVSPTTLVLERGGSAVSTAVSLARGAKFGGFPIELVLRNAPDFDWIAMPGAPTGDSSTLSVVATAAAVGDHAATLVGEARDANGTLVTRSVTLTLRVTDPGQPADRFTIAVLTDPLVVDRGGFARTVVQMTADHRIDQAIRLEIIGSVPGMRFTYTPPVIGGTIGNSALDAFADAQLAVANSYPLTVRASTPTFSAEATFTLRVR